MPKNVENNSKTEKRTETEKNLTLPGTMVLAEPPRTKESERAWRNFDRAVRCAARGILFIAGVGVPAMSQITQSVPVGELYVPFHLPGFSPVWCR